MKALVLLFLLCVSCSSDNNPYRGDFLDVTNCGTSGEYIFSPGGIKVYLNGNNVDIYLIDSKVNELESCLDKNIEREYIAVCIPDDWYVSPCTGQQLVPSSVDYRLCEEKGVEITEECREAVYPTVNCPCPCSVRAEVQNNHIVVTAPNLELFKAALARIVMYPKYVWSTPEIAACL